MNANTNTDITINSAKLFVIKSFMLIIYLFINLFTLLLSKCSCISIVSETKTNTIDDDGGGGGGRENVKRNGGIWGRRGGAR